MSEREWRGHAETQWGARAAVAQAKEYTRADGLACDGSGASGVRRAVLGNCSLLTDVDPVDFLASASSNQPALLT